MAKKSKPQPYKVWMRPAAHASRKQLPGKVRQRIKRAIADLGSQPRPPHSIPLRLPLESTEAPAEPEWEVRRFRLDNWRIVYAVNEAGQEVAVLTIQRRPPYDYSDLDQLLSELK